MNDHSSTGSILPNLTPREGYAGDLDAASAWRVIEGEPNSVLVDVRTRPEWEFVGVPVLDSLNKQTVFIEWQAYPTMAPNPDFAQQLGEAGVSQDATVLFICRSGARSAAAASAMTAAGYATCINVSGGFEGPHDQDKHRGGSDGWKAQSLPWAQG